MAITRTSRLSSRTPNVSKSNFEEFVQRENQAVTDTKGEPVDWTAQRDEWLKHLNELYALIEGFLSEYVHAKQVLIEYKNVTLVEEYIGQYSARQMTIRIGRKEIRLQPLGTLLIGTKGRVDAIGPLGQVPILLLNSEARSLRDMIKVSVSIAGGPPSRPISPPKTSINWAWRIVSKPPERKIIELNKDTFLNLLTELANG
jgi:hypothetical protein